MLAFELGYNRGLEKQAAMFPALAGVAKRFQGVPRPRPLANMQPIKAESLAPMTPQPIRVERLAPRMPGPFADVGKMVGKSPMPVKLNPQGWPSEQLASRLAPNMPQPSPKLTT